MIRTVFITVALLPAITLAQDPGKSADLSKGTVAELLAAMKEREKSVKSVQLEMSTRGSYPGGGMSFQIDGSIRVLEGTHFHVTTKARFEDDLTAESETVRTPRGVWMREWDPAHNRVFTRMEPELLRELEAAAEFLGEDARAPGVVENQADAPLGSAMLEALNRHFALGVEKHTDDGVEYYRVAGELKDDREEVEAGGLPAPDRVELLIGTDTLAVMRMTQFEGGAETMRMQVRSLKTDVPMDRASFKIELPEGAQFIDVMDHLPSRMHIDQLLEEARAKRARLAAEAAEGEGNEKGAAKGGGKGESKGKDGR